MKEYVESVGHEYDSIVCHLLRSSQYLPNKFTGKKILEITDLPSLNYHQLINQLSIFNQYDNTKELYNLIQDPNEEHNLIGNSLDIENQLWAELKKLDVL